MKLYNRVFFPFIKIGNSISICWFVYSKTCNSQLFTQTMKVGLGGRSVGESLYFQTPSSQDIIMKHVTHSPYKENSCMPHLCMARLRVS